MGDRYIFPCPNCKGELFLADWNNYVDRCLKCGKYYRISFDLKEISHAEFDHYGEFE